MSDRVSTEIKALLVTETLPALGPEVRPTALGEAALLAKLETLFRNTRIAASKQELIRALLLLWHDHLAASHQISQSIENADGSFIHAIMHRREPDYWNAKYWWRRVGSHPAFPEIARRVGDFLKAQGATALTPKLLPKGSWDACHFVDLCEQEARAPYHSRLLCEIQRIETEALLEQLLPGNATP